MAKEIFGVILNEKEELNSALIKEIMGSIPNSEIPLFETEFITEESLNRGVEIANNMLPKIELE